MAYGKRENTIVSAERSVRPGSVFGISALFFFGRTGLFLFYAEKAGLSFDSEKGFHGV